MLSSLAAVGRRLFPAVAPLPALLFKPTTTPTSSLFFSSGLATAAVVRKPTTASLGSLSMTSRPAFAQPRRFASGPATTTTTTTTTTTPTATKATATVLTIEERYPRSLQWLHLLMAAGFLINIGLVLQAQQMPNQDDGTAARKEILAQRRFIMETHESIGILLLGLMIPRVFIRLASRMPAKMPGPSWEHAAGTVSHALLYGTIIFMPVSGLAFGYFSCWGVPFFGWHIPGAKKEDENKTLTDFFYWGHHKVGQFLEYLLVLHVGAVAFHHLIRNHNLLRRMNPFANAPAPGSSSNKF